MSEPKFSSGRWFVNGGDHPNLISCGHGHICEVTTDVPFISQSERGANKALLVTSPKLYAATDCLASLIEEYLSIGSSSGDWESRCKAAVQLARAVAQEARDE